MSGLIVLFWLLDGSEALRYLVSASLPLFPRKSFALDAHLRTSIGPVRRRHVVSLCPLGRDWCGFLSKKEMG